PAELYSKLDLKLNVILKNKNFIIEDLLNYYKYIGDDGVPRTENLKITQSLYEAQRIRQYMYGEIMPNIPHYTPEQFLNLCMDAVLNICYVIKKNNIDSEIFFENFYCDNKLFNFCRYEKPTQSRIDL